MRKLLGYAVLVLALLLIGCGSKEQVKQETTELFYDYTVSPAGALRFDGYGYLHFYSSETDSWVYLCNRPGCLHSDSSCGAYWGPNPPRDAFFYDGSLYVWQIASSALDGRLIRANRYGEERQEMVTVESFPYPLSTRLVGSDQYFLGEIWEDAGNSKEKVLYRVNLENGTYDMFPRPDTGYAVEYFDGYAVTDDYLYYLYIVSDVDFNDLIDGDSFEFIDESWREIVYMTRLYRMDRKTEEFELLLERTTEWFVPHTIEILEPRGKQLLLVLEDQVVEYDPDTGETTLLLDMATVTSDDWMNMKPVGEMWIVNVGNSQFVLLKDWKEVGRFSGPWEAYYQALGMCNEIVYFVGHNGLSYMNYEDLVNGDYTIQDADGY